MHASQRCRRARLIAAALFASQSLAWGGASFNSSASTSKLFFDPDLSGGTQSKTVSGNPPISSGAMPTPSSYQLSQTFSSGSSTATGKGSLGYILNATTATFTLSAGTGVAQVDASNAYAGASQLRVDFDGRFNPTSPSFGPTAMGYVSLVIGGVVGTGGYAYFKGEVDFLNGNTNALLRPKVVFGATTFSTVGSFSKPYSSSSLLGSGTIPVGTPIRVKGFFEFRASNADEPSDMLPLHVDIGSAPPTATWYSEIGGNWNDPIVWAPPANADVDDPTGTIPVVPNGVGVRARLVEPPLDLPLNLTLNGNTTVGTLDYDSRRRFTIDSDGVSSMIFDVEAGNAVVQVRNVRGENTQVLNAPVILNDSLDVHVDGSYFGPGHPNPHASFTFGGAITQTVPASITKFGEGELIFNLPSTHTGGTVIAGGHVGANATAALGPGSVQVNDGQLNYNAAHAAAPGQAVQVLNNGQVDLGIAPDATELFVLTDLGAVSGSATELVALTNGTNLQLSTGAMIAHETFDTNPLVNNPGGIAGPPAYIFGIAADIPTDATPHVIAVGSAAPGPWKGFGGDRSDRLFGTDPTTTQDRVEVMGQAELVSLHQTTIINGQVLSVGGGASLLKRGGGAVILNNVANQFDGPITVQANSGALLVDGVLVAQPNLNVVVQNGGALGGVGVINGPVNVQGGGILSPGSNVFGFDVATLTTGPLALADSSVLDFDLSDPNIVGGGVNDLVVVNGDLLLDGILNIADVANFAPGDFTLFQFSGGLEDAGLLMGNVPLPDEYLYSVSIVPPASGLPGAVVLNVSPVPEPTCAGVLLGLGMGLKRRRR
jgi:hypothetical protein